MSVLLLEVAEVHLEFDAGGGWPGRARQGRLCRRLLALRTVQHSPLHPAPHSSVRVQEALNIEEHFMNIGERIGAFYDHWLFLILTYLKFCWPLSPKLGQLRQSCLVKQPVDIES